MIVAELELLDQNLDWQRVLASYREKELAAAEAHATQSKQARTGAEPSEELLDNGEAATEHPKFTADWTPRLVSVAEIADADLSAIHGKLIAFGFLKFKLLNRSDGLGYQLTRLGKQAALGPEERLGTAADDQPDDAAPQNHELRLGCQTRVKEQEVANRQCVEID